MNADAKGGEFVSGWHGKDNRLMLVYFDTDVYSHIESLEKITVSDRDLLLRCAASNRISIYFSDLNALELCLMIERNAGGLARIARIARRLCPVRRVSKGLKQLLPDDVKYYLRHGRGRQVDIRWKLPAHLRRPGDQIDELIEFAETKPAALIKLTERLKNSRPFFELFSDFKNEVRHEPEPAKDVAEFLSRNMEELRGSFVKYIWFESGLSDASQMERQWEDLPIEDMQSFRILAEYWIILMWFGSVGSPDGKDRQPKKMEPGDGHDMEHAILSGFADVFVSDDRRARERYRYLSDPLPGTQPKPNCVDLPSFVQTLRQVGGSATERP